MNHIQEIIQSVIDETSSGFCVLPCFCFEEKEQVSPMSFRPDDNTICIRTNSLFQYYEKMQEYGISFLSFRDFVNVVLSHELGHYSDSFILERERNKQNLMKELEEQTSLYGILSILNKMETVVLEAEIVAWDFSYSYMWEHIDRILVKRFRELCLQQYKDRFQQYREMFMREHTTKAS